MDQKIGETWCQVEIYNEYLKKIASLLTQINTVEQMQYKAQKELEMLQTKPDNNSRTQYQNRLLSTQEQCDQRLKDMMEELALVQAMKKQLENELPILNL